MRRQRAGTRPENLDYPDKGCEFSEHCLDCPLQRCKHDGPGGGRQILLLERDREIARLHREGVKVNELARRFGINRRNVFRAIERAEHAG